MHQESESASSVGEACLKNPALVDGTIEQCSYSQLDVLWDRAASVMTDVQRARLFARILKEGPGVTVIKGMLGCQICRKFLSAEQIAELERRAPTE